MSKNIGKLYLVAQSNARSIIKSNEESLAAAREEAQRNISSIESAHNVLSEIKSELLEKTAEFNDSLVGLSTELERAKSVIKENEAESEAKIEEVKASCDGMVFSLREYPAVCEGELLARICKAERPAGKYE